MKIIYSSWFSEETQKIIDINLSTDATDNAESADNPTDIDENAQNEADNIQNAQKDHINNQPYPNPPQLPQRSVRFVFKDDDVDEIRNKVKMDDYWTTGGGLPVIWPNHNTTKFVHLRQQSSSLRSKSRKSN